MSTFHEKIAAYYHEAKGAKRKAAEFLLSHTDEAAFMTLEEIAKKTNVSPATITRTVVEIGYQGFPEMLKELRQAVRQARTPAERLGHISHNEDVFGFCESVENDYHNIEKMLSFNSMEAIYQTVELLAKAKQIKLFASRSSYGPIAFLTFALAHIREGVTILREDEGRLPEQLIDIASDDLFFIADLPRYAQTSLQVAAEAKEAGCRLIAMTDGPAAPIVKYADAALFVPYDSYSFFNSNVAVLALYNGLATALNIRLKETSVPRLGRYNALIERFRMLNLRKKSHDE